ncbi:MAG: hypothetical protein JW918_14225 [Anaerolineae bacterium]|nr:hypothetical protein [Anaerolineae bacterium]
MSTKIRVVLPIALIGLLLLAACGESTPTPEPTERPLMSFDFEEACRRGSIDRAPAYEPEAGSGKIHPMVLFKRDTADDSYLDLSPDSFELPIPWMVDYGGDYGTVELVVCMTGIESTLAEDCAYEDDDSGEEYTLHVYETTYEVKVYAAHSGEELGTTTVKAEFETCPMFHMFSDKEEDSYVYPPVSPVQEFLQQYVEP